jgi:hypothetical protein
MLMISEAAAMANEILSVGEDDLMQASRLFYFVLLCLRWVNLDLFKVHLLASSSSSILFLGTYLVGPRSR